MQSFAYFIRLSKHMSVLCFKISHNSILKNPFQSYVIKLWAGNQLSSILIEALCIFLQSPQAKLRTEQILSFQDLCGSNFIKILIPCFTRWPFHFLSCVTVHITSSLPHHDTHTLQSLTRRRHRCVPVLVTQ
jgi:hypothetical protein